MMVSGTAILAFLIFHILQFTTLTIDVTPLTKGAIYANLYNAFQEWYFVLIYLVAVVLVGAHLRHAAWSLFQTLGLDDPEPVLDKARLEAVRAAKARAALLVGAAGVKLGRVLSISEGGGYVPPMPMPMYRMEADTAKAVPVEGGEVGLMASVTMVFEIEQ